MDQEKFNYMDGLVHITKFKELVNLQQRKQLALFYQERSTKLDYDVLVGFLINDLIEAGATEFDYEARHFLNLKLSQELRIQQNKIEDAPDVLRMALDNTFLEESRIIEILVNHLSPKDMLGVIEEILSDEADENEGDN